MKKLIVSSLLLSLFASQPLFAQELPLRETALHEGYTVAWHAQDKSVTLTSDYASVTFQSKDAGLSLLSDKLYMTSDLWASAQASLACPQDHSTLDDIIYPLREGENTYYVNQKLGLSLEENPSTGYIWVTEFPSGIELISDHYSPNPSNLPGAPGMHTWLLKATVPGDYTLTFKKERPFEPNQPIETKTYTLHAETFVIPTK